MDVIRLIYLFRGEEKMQTILLAAILLASAGEVETEILVDAQYTGSLGTGHIYRCFVRKVLRGKHSQKEVLLQTMAGSPLGKKLGGMKGTTNLVLGLGAQIKTATANRYEKVWTRDGKYWVLLSVRQEKVPELVATLEVKDQNAVIDASKPLSLTYTIKNVSNHDVVFFDARPFGFIKASHVEAGETFLHANDKKYLKMASVHYHGKEHFKLLKPGETIIHAYQYPLPLTFRPTKEKPYIQVWLDREVLQKDNVYYDFSKGNQPIAIKAWTGCLLSNLLVLVAKEYIQSQ